MINISSSSSVKAAPTADVVDITERALCGARPGSGCLIVDVDGSDSDASSSSSSPDDAVVPFETSSSSEAPSSVAAAVETPEASVSPFIKDPATPHKPGPVNQDTPELASTPIEAAAKTNGAHTKHQLTSTLLPILLTSLGFILFA